MKSFIKHLRGFTLIELILVIIVLGVLSSVIGPLIYGLIKSTFVEIAISDIDSQARFALARMNRELRIIRSNSSSDFNDPLSASQITFTDVYSNTITYSLSGTTLRRTLDGGTARPLASNVTSLTFTYYGADGNVTSTPALVKYITIGLVLTRNNSSLSLSSTTYPRNFL